MIANGEMPRTVIVLPFVLAMAACASGAPEHFYTVSAESSELDPSVAMQQIVLSPIVIPTLIDRPQIVVRTSSHEIVVLEYHRWAEPLAVDLTRALIKDLRRLQSGTEIVAADNLQNRKAEKNLVVVISELISGPGPSTSLQASWELKDRTLDCVSQGNFHAAIPTSAGDEAVPAAYAEAISRLAEAIAQTLRERRTCAEN